MYTYVQYLYMGKLKQFTNLKSWANLGVACHPETSMAWIGKIGIP